MSVLSWPADAQGFTKGTTSPKEMWYGYIKDYDGGTLMQCEIHDEVNYLDIPGMVRVQRKVRCRGDAVVVSALGRYCGCVRGPQ